MEPETHFGMKGGERTMKRAGLLILLVISGLFLVQCSHSEEKLPMTSQAVQPGGAPVAQFLETSHDLGKVGEGEVYSHEFTVRNAGTGVLEIKKVLPG
jgi:hypothetical protein